jgi:hypothetical protein
VAESVSGAKLALIGAVAVVFGAVLGGAAQVVVELLKQRADQAQVRMARAEEIITLVSKSPDVYGQVKQQILLHPLDTQQPTDPERVVALVTLYFPGVLPQAQDFDDNITFKRIYDTRKALMAALSATARASEGGATRTTGRLKAYCDFAAATFALLAAFAWFVAARHPVTLPSAAMFAESMQGREHIAHVSRILRGVRWNTAAAVLTGLSALSMSLSWLAH